MDSLLLAPLAPLGELDLALDLLLVLAAPIVDALALAAGELDESILRHSEEDYSGIRAKGQSGYQPQGGDWVDNDILWSVLV